MSSKTQIDAVQEIMQASACGREIVCLIGAGVSVDAGIPRITKLTEYLAKVQCYITKGAFQPKKTPEDHHPHFGEEYLDDPSRYVGHFGWPDPNQLNADLWQWIDQGFVGDPGERREYMDYLVRAEQIADLLRFEPGLEQARLVKKLKKDQRKGKVRFNNRKWEKSGLWHLRGNWKTLLAYLTNSNPDYADTLFQSLILDRCPGMAHRFLAFLTPILGLRLFLTVNFDDLLEKALRTEGHDPVVYAVARDSPLPHPSLVRNRMSVIKLHGDAFRLLIGEGLDGPLDEDSKSRLKNYMGERFLLLVLGVGGSDRRIMDLVDLVAQQWKKGDEAAVYWVHFGTKPPKSVQKLVNRKCGAVCTVPTHSPASFLLEIFTRQTGAHPPSLRPYEPRMLQPIVPESGNGNSSEPGCVTVFRERKEHFDFGASLDLACFVASKSVTHIPIWVDLSGTHTYKDLAVEIIRQIRRYDRSVPPLALPGEPGPEGVSKTVRQVFATLVRDRYVLALNNVGSFGRPPTYHHWPRKDRPEGMDDPGRGAREAFLSELIRQACHPNGPMRDSLLALSLPKESFPGLEEGDEGGKDWGRDKEPLPKEFKEVYGDALLLLAASRRRWNYVALQELLPDYLPNGERTPEHVDRFLKQIEWHYVLRSEGAEYWMCRGMRDHVYERGRKGTWSKKWPSDSGSLPEGDDLAPRLARLARIHTDLASYNYGHLYAASQEPYALLESLYHQIASLRYLTRLDSWLQLQLRLEQPQSSEALSRWLENDSEQNDSERCKDPLETVHALRLRRLRILQHILKREREAFLSLICSDTLISWVHWIREQDLPQLCVDEPWQECQALTQSWMKLGELLFELEVDALRNNMDFYNCRLVRWKQICDWAFKGQCVPVDELVNWASSQSSKDCLTLFRSLCDIWLCLRSMAQHGDEGQLYNGLDRIRKRAEELFINGSDEQQRDLEAMMIRWLRGDADRHLMKISPWALRMTTAEEKEKVVESCKEAIETCEKALRTIEWAASDDYARHCSYFHSYKGRAHYIRAYLSPMWSDDFTVAHLELDRAQAGLLPQMGANRESLAVSLLRLAECLMVRADTFLQSRDALEALNSAERELGRAVEVLNRAESMLDGARQNLEWWSCLYQLRAQIQVEQFLLQMSGYRSEDPEVSKLDARLPHTMQAGLRAVRQGLNVLLPIVQSGDCRLQPSSRMERFLRIWIELAVCGAMLARIGWRASQPPAGHGMIDEETNVLWARWTSLNKTAGLEVLVNGDEGRKFFAMLNRRLEEPPTYGLKARHTALCLIAEAIAEIGMWKDSWIWKLLRPELTERRPALEISPPMPPPVSSVEPS